MSVRRVGWVGFGIVLYFQLVGKKAPANRGGDGGIDLVEFSQFRVLLRAVLHRDSVQALR